MRKLNHVEQYQLFKEKLYQWYVEDWLYLRGITKKDIDPETGVKKGLFKNQMYASMAEFLDNEYQDENFLNTLCQHHGYKNLDALIDA